MDKPVILGAIFLLATVGCAPKRFVNLGNGSGVPVDSVDRYMSEHGVSRAEARQQLATQVEHPEVGDAIFAD